MGHPSGDAGAVKVQRDFSREKLMSISARRGVFRETT